MTVPLPASLHYPQGLPPLPAQLNIVPLTLACNSLDAPPELRKFKKPGRLVYSKGAVGSFAMIR